MKYIHLYTLLLMLVCHTSCGQKQTEPHQDNTVTQVSQTGASAVLEDKKGNIWTASNLEINGKVWALSRFDQKSLYDKKPPATQIILREQFAVFLLIPGF